jgi:hypothetical protein
MTLVRFMIVLALLPIAYSAPASDPAYAPLWLYEGTWRVTRKDSPKPDEMKNRCAVIGKYFACQQEVNGSVTALLIIIPGNTPGHYYTQNVMPQGRAGGVGELTISGDRWVFSSIWNEGSKTVRYRTTNVFNGKTRIHFEQEESTDGTHWELKNSGDEVRASGAAR